MFKMTINDAIAIEMKRKTINELDIASKTDLPITHVRKLIRSRTITVNSTPELPAIASALSVPLDSLVNPKIRNKADLILLRMTKLELCMGKLASMIKKPYFHVYKWLTSCITIPDEALPAISKALDIPQHSLESVA